MTAIRTGRGPSRIYPSELAATKAAQDAGHAIPAVIDGTAFTVYPSGRTRRGGWRTKCLDASGYEITVYGDAR